MNKYIEGKDINLPSEFITTINSLSLSTSRGILFMLFRGTFLHSAILPIIDSSDYFFRVICIQIVSFLEFLNVISSALNA